jgi:capsular polysaccharide biosynthesis protein
MKGSFRFIGYGQELVGEIAPDRLVRSFVLECNVIRDALVTPLVMRREPGAIRTISGAVYDQSGTLVAHSQRAISENADTLRIVNPQRIEHPCVARRLRGPVLFCGIIWRPFGLLLIESMSRLWALAGLDGNRISAVFQAAAPRSRQVLERRYVRYMVEALGIRAEQCEVVEQEPLVCEELIVPGSTFCLASHVHPRFPEVYDRIMAARRIEPGASRRIYLSRRELPDRMRHIANEAEIEALCSARGFQVVHPETLPFEKQIALINGAEAIAGCDGSALHMAAFARPGTKTLNFRVGNPLRNQMVIESVRGLDAIHVHAGDEEAGGLLCERHRRTQDWTADLSRVNEGLEIIDNL